MAMATQGFAVVPAPMGGGPGGGTRRTLAAGGGGSDPPLPDEVLRAPVDAGHLFVERMDEWRKALGWSHKDFARYLDISKQYWWLLRTGRRGLTIGVAQRVLRERPELEHFLAAAIRARTWGHGPDEHPVEGAGPEGR